MKKFTFKVIFLLLAILTPSTMSVSCTSDSQCISPLKPACDTVLGECVGCDYWGGSADFNC